MKTIILSLLLSASSVMAGITALMVEPMPAINPTSYKVVAYGLLPEGQPKFFEYKTASDMAKMIGVENCAQFDLNRKAIRYWIYFKKDGTIDRTDFQLEPPFESKTFNSSFDAQVLIKVSTLKDHVETKSESNEIKPTPIDTSKDIPK